MGSDSDILGSIATPRTIEVTIPGPMRGKQRARTVRRGNFVSSYTPKETVNAESWVRHCAVQQAGQPCLEGALALDVSVLVAIPASWSKKKQAAAQAGDVRPTGKPDNSNMLKLIEDALNGVLWKDDAQIVSVSMTKFGAE